MLYPSPLLLLLANGALCVRDVQGQNYVVDVMMKAGLPERETFCLFLYLLRQGHLHGIYRKEVTMVVVVVSRGGSPRVFLNRFGFFRGGGRGYLLHTRWSCRKIKSIRELWYFESRPTDNRRMDSTRLGESYIGFSSHERDPFFHFVKRLHF